MSIKLVLADDHPFILFGLQQLFALEPDLNVVACCTTGEETLWRVREHQPDVAVLDIRMPGKDGLTVLRDMRKEGLTTPVVILTAELNEDEVLEAVCHGARDVILKEMAPRALVNCIREVHAGEVWLMHSAFGTWLENHSTGRALKKIVRCESGRLEMARVLTAREAEIAHMIGRGLRNKEIGSRLFISEGTVKIHLHSIYNKLNLDNRLALALYVQRQGLE